MTTPIHDFLKAYSDAGLERCHMPGHKGLCGSYDLTEVDGAVDIIYESERNAAELFGASRTLFSCSGSTLAIFAMLSPFSGKRLVAARYSHRSLTDAAILLGLEIDWVYPGESLRERVTGETAAVFVTDIDYYGRMCDIEAVAGVCGEYGVPLLVDNAHGAYLVFTDAHPIKLGAALCADSAHKSLPALTGAAYLHVKDEAFYPRVRAAAEMFGTSSPSYLILDSLDLCNRHIRNQKENALAAFAAVGHLKSLLKGAGYSLLEVERDGYFSGGQCALRVTVDANAYGYVGCDYATELKNRGVMCEMSDSRYVVLLFSTVTEPKNTARVFAAMRGIPRQMPLNPPTYSEISPVLRAERVMSAREAFFSPKQTVPTMRAVGRVCGGVHVTVPPCVPAIIPGEVVTKEIAEVLEKRGLNRLNVL